jgi:hypothetical protein
MAAFDAQIIDLLRQVEHRVAFDAEIEKGIEPFTAGIEMNHGAFELAFAELGVPWAHAGALEAGAEHHLILIEAFDMRRL